MDTPSPIPPVIKKRFLNQSCSMGRLFIEIILAGVAGMAATVLPVLFVSGRHLPADYNYMHIAFFPMLMEAASMPASFQYVSYGLLLAISLALGFFGRGPIWLIGPAIMLIYPIWSFIDLAADGDSHQLWPFEMVAYGVMSLIYIIPTGIGRLVRRWWIKPR